MKFANWVYILGSIITTSFLTNDSIAATNKAANPDKKPEQQFLEQTVPTPSTYSENINKLLIAEIALQQNKPEIAIKNYLEVLKSSGDVKIAELALECALKNKAFNEATEIALLWAEFAKNDINPQLIATTLLLDIKPERAKTYIKQAASIESKELDQYLLFTYKKLPTTSQHNLYTVMQQLATEYASNAYLQVSAAQIAAQEDHIKEADKLVEKAIQLKPDLTHAIELKAKLIRHHADQDQPALQYLHEEIKKSPQDEELKLFYSNALLDNNDIKHAMPYLKELINSKIFGIEAQYTIGEIYLAQQQFQKAYQTLLKVIDDRVFGSSAKYNLGQICELQNQNKEAIQWYSEVREGQYHVTATLKAALLLAGEGAHKQAINLMQSAEPVTFVEQKQLLLIETDLLVEIKEFEQAIKLLDDAIAVVPYDVDFLYSHSLVAGLLNLPEQSEQDLQAILAIEPEHANALNALGYTLSNRPERSKEALVYLKKALELSPDNPAFMDSMGWALFRAGEVKDSMALLKNAYNLSKDSEIAAHLGEVLWTTGKRAQAKKIWHKALQNTPHNNILLETLSRLHIQLDALAQ